MADFYAFARSNYFAVRDEAAFRAAVADLSVEVVTTKPGGDELRLALLSRTDHGTWPTSCYDEDAREDSEIDLVALVAEHLAPDEVAVFMEAGAEKMRYIGAHATAINAAGDRRDLDLDAIYEIAAELGPNITRAEW